MKKVLITGATASQSSLEANKQKVRFGGLLHNALSSAGLDVETRETNLSENFNNYEKVIVGLAPVTSLSANKIYTALDALNRAEDKAVLLLDLPDPHFVYKSMKSVLSNESIIFKSLYNKRLNFQDLVENKNFYNSVISGMEKVYAGKIPVIVPSVPYHKHSPESLNINTSSLIELNFDSYFMNDNFYQEKEKSNYWLTDSMKSEWSQNVSKTLFNPVLNYKRSHYDYDLSLVDRILGSFGYLKNNHKYDNPWWSRNIMLTLSCGVPVFADWRQTSVMGDAWRILPQSVEEITHLERKELADEQKSSYLSFCPAWDEIAEYSISQIFK